MPRGRGGGGKRLFEVEILACDQLSRIKHASAGVRVIKTSRGGSGRSGESSKQRLSSRLYTPRHGRRAAT